MHPWIAVLIGLIKRGDDFGLNAAEAKELAADQHVGEILIVGEIACGFANGGRGVICGDAVDLLESLSIFLQHNDFAGLYRYWTLIDDL